MKHGNGFKDITGKKFGRLTVLKNVGRSADRKALWEARCKCGNTITTLGKSLRLGHTQSCGCLQVDRARQANTRHGFASKGKHHKLYHVWGAMKRRVLNKNNWAYKYYGGRGITICDEWTDFENFKEWAFKNGYAQGLTIDRVDNNKGYFPENCVWVEKAQQSRNRRNCVKYLGETATEASKRLGGCRTLVAARIREYGWDIKRAFTTKAKP